MKEKEKEKKRKRQRKKSHRYPSRVIQLRGSRRPRQLVVTDGGWWWMVDCGGWWMVDGFQKGSSILLKILSDEVQVI